MPRMLLAQEVGKQDGVRPAAELQDPGWSVAANDVGHDRERLLVERPDTKLETVEDAQRAPAVQALGGSRRVVNQGVGKCIWAAERRANLMHTRNWCDSTVALTDNAASRAAAEGPTSTTIGVATSNQRTSSCTRSTSSS